MEPARRALPLPWIAIATGVVLLIVGSALSRSSDLTAREIDSLLRGHASQEAIDLRHWFVDLGRILGVLLISAGVISLPRFTRSSTGSR